jgi:hypothetical protein
MSVDPAVKNNFLLHVGNTQEYRPIEVGLRDPGLKSYMHELSDSGWTFGWPRDFG